MLIRTNPASRREILRGMLCGGAVTVSLPFLDMFLNDAGTALAATGAPLPSRFGTWFWGLGIEPAIFTPTTVGPLGELPLQLMPLEKVKRHVNIFTNFDVRTETGVGDGHVVGWVALRSGTAAGTPDGPSLDIAVANMIHGGTRFRSVQMAATGDPRHSYSFQGPDAINPPEISAVELYRKLFGADFQDPNSTSFTPDPRTMMNKSILSGVSEQRRDLVSGLGAADKSRLDEYFTSIREIENRLALQLEKPVPAASCNIPKEVKAAMDGLYGDVVSPQYRAMAAKLATAGLDAEVVSARHRAMVDLVAMALACNQTRVFNMVYSAPGSSITRKGLDKPHHAYTHEEPNDPEKGYQVRASEFVQDAMTEWAYLIGKLAATPEGDGSLLDRSLIYAHSELTIAKTHKLTNIPMLTAGTLNGTVKAGQHVRGTNHPASRLGYTVQRLMGVHINDWGTRSMNAVQDIGEIVA